jgi:hypothetical protein
MTNGYFLRGLDQEMILVIRSPEEETLMKIIKKIQACRDKELKELGLALEKSFYEGRDTSTSRPKNTRTTTGRKRNPTRKSANAKPRIKPSP